MEYIHKTVLLNEVTEGLAIKPDGVYVDCTLGGGGHTKNILSRLGEKGVVIGIDLDDDAISNAEKTINDSRLKLWKGNFNSIRQAVVENGFTRIDGVVMDLGVSSHQIDSADRGFSYMQNSLLDMRMDRTSPLTAAIVVNTYPPEELERILREYGEERFSRKIAYRISEYRTAKPVETTGELVKIIEEACPRYSKNEGHIAKRTFQALRIEVNGELDSLKTALEEGIDLLSPSGRIAVISFHSLEDRIVKTTFNLCENPCACPRDLPICVCGKKPKLKIITRKPILSSQEEASGNPRSRSAKLRIGEKL
ncbi:MAG: 16S rRNA (cytosine(1402)-N(4))-methyltransferase RsmH [Clostridiales bacterium]|nr:16S rRNA (cytosine(1402)-N(4))-methyltransferase RsmH [Clostridiales bacterium]